MAVKFGFLAKKHNNNTILGLHTLIQGQPKQLLGNDFPFPESILE